MSDNAIALLEADHRRMLDLFQQYRAQDGHAEEQARLLHQLCREAEVHIQLEEEIFYPAVRGRAGQEGKDLVATLHQEHDIMRDLIKRLGEVDARDEAYRRTVQALHALFSHHVRREEERLLSLAKVLLGGELENMGQSLQVRKSQLLDSPQAGI